MGHRPHLAATAMPRKGHPAAHARQPCHRHYPLQGDHGFPSGSGSVQSRRRSQAAPRCCRCQRLPEPVRPLTSRRQRGSGSSPRRRHPGHSALHGTLVGSPSRLSGAGLRTRCDGGRPPTATLRRRTDAASACKTTPPNFPAGRAAGTTSALTVLLNGLPSRPGTRPPLAPSAGRPLGSMLTVG